MYFFFFLVDVLPSLTCPFVVPRMAQTVWLMDTLLVWFINPSMSWPACPVTVHQCVPEYLCPSCTCLFRHWCNQLKPAKTGSEVTPPSWTSVRHNCFLMIPQSKGHSVRGVKKVKTFSRVVSSTSLCLLNLRASIDFHWERKKKQSKRNLTHKLLLTSTSFSYFLHYWVVFKSREWTVGVFTHDGSVAVGPD